MKHYLFIVTILLLSGQFLNAQVQRAKVVAVESKTIKALDAKVLKLDRQGATVLAT